jgi:uncharacterized protein YdeI (YjbR/CyaY-like superfamily)
MSISEIETYYPKTKQYWRKWLLKNHVQKDAVWLITYKKSANKPTVTWSDAVDEALCFGWIDSIKKTLDDERSIQFFSKRKPKSTWSKINKAKVEQLIASKQMTAAGLACIEIAKQNGSWTILDAIEELEIPKDLEKEFKKKVKAKTFFTSLSKSNKKIILYWLMSAKRSETREKRLKETVDSLSQEKKPNNF